MGESVEVPALRASPATALRIRTLGMGHFICDAALDATRRFAADESFCLYALHKILSIEKPPIIAALKATRRQRQVSTEGSDSLIIATKAV